MKRMPSFANNNYLADLQKEKIGVSAGTITTGSIAVIFFRASPAKHRSILSPCFMPARCGPISGCHWSSSRPHAGAEVRFRIAGTAKKMKTCKQLAVELDCKNVEFLGICRFLSGEAMRQADIFLFPSIIEGHPQVLGQAAACGIPVIAMKIYRPDYVVDGMTGFVVDNDNELAAKLDLLIQQPELRRAMGDAAIAHAQKFDWDVIARQWQDAFERAVVDRRKH